MEDVQHHALAGVRLVLQGLGALCHPGFQLLRQLLGAVKLQCVAAADKHQTPQRKGNVVQPGTAHHVEGETFPVKPEPEGWQYDRQTQAKGQDVACQQIPGRALFFRQCPGQHHQYRRHAGQQGDAAQYRLGGCTQHQKQQDAQDRERKASAAAPGKGHMEQGTAQPEGREHGKGKIQPHQEPEQCAGLPGREQHSQPPTEHDA